MAKFKNKIVIIFIFFVLELISAFGLDYVFSLGFIDSRAITSFLFLGIIFFFSSSGDAAANMNISDAMIALIPPDTMKKDQSPKLHSIHFFLVPFYFLLLVWQLV